MKSQEFHDQGFSGDTALIIRVLGCHGSKYPGFNTTGFLINENILVDAGAVVSVLTPKEKAHIDFILVTHAHLDYGEIHILKDGQIIQIDPS